MLKRAAITLFVLMLVGGAAFLVFAPKQFDSGMNRVQRDIPLPAVSQRANALHRSLFIADMHADPLLWKRDLARRHEHGHTDLPRLQAGNVGLQVFGSVTKTPANQNYDSNPSDSDMITYVAIGNLQPVRTWNSLYERSLYHAWKLEDLQQRTGGAIRVLYSRDDLETFLLDRDQVKGLVGALLALEGAQPIEGDVDKLNGLFDAGYRMVGLAHFFDNEVAGSMHGEDKYGLSPLGRELVAKAEEIGMTVDIAHSSAAAVSDVFDMATKPVVVSHGGVRAVCDYNRNLDDDQLKRLKVNGGVIGIGYWDAAVCDSTPAGIVTAMSHVRDLIGVEHIGLGSDFDGAVTTRFDTSELAVLTQALMDADYSEEEIRAIMGGNVLRVLRATLP